MTFWRRKSGVYLHLEVRVELGEAELSGLSEHLLAFGGKERNKMPLVCAGARARGWCPLCSIRSIHPFKIREKKVSNGIDWLLRIGAIGSKLAIRAVRWSEGQTQPPIPRATSGVRQSIDGHANRHGGGWFKVCRVVLARTASPIIRGFFISAADFRAAWRSAARFPALWGRVEGSLSPRSREMARAGLSLQQPFGARVALAGSRGCGA